eukprot:Sspe_Gene.59231::Locus_32525_Transcript_1_1_Confidence_1.000_Length_1018::g.59231::m.59231/K17839/PAO4, PAO3, PAO2; polyamine oxidase
MARVLVLGGGVAGLACSKALADDGFDVVVTEGRDRLGGRCCTHTFQNGARADLGANFIHGACTEHPVAAIAVQTPGVVLGGVPNGFWEDTVHTRYYDAKRGGEVPLERNAEMVMAYDTLLHKMAKHRHVKRRKTAQDDNSDNYKAAMDAALEKLPAMDDVLHGMLLTHAQKAVGYVARLDDLSLQMDCPRSPARPTKSAGQIKRCLENSLKEVEPPPYGEKVALPEDPEDLLVVSGYDFMVGALRHPSVDYRLRAVVKNVDCSPDGVAVTLDDGTTMRGDAAVCTLPLGVLKGKHPETCVTFTPPLSDEKLGAISRMDSGAHNK